MTQTKTTDRELMGYLDGELDDDVRARVEAALADDPTMRAKLADLQMVGDLVRETVDADGRADDIADGVMAKLDEPVVEDDKVIPLRKTTTLEGQPANDNSRTIWTLAAAAAAVAAGLFIWSSTATDTAPIASRDEAPAPAEAPTLTPAPETLGAAPDVAEEGALEDDDEPVEIAQMEFGAAQTGSLFRVGDQNTGTATAVVWVTSLGDDE